MKSYQQFFAELKRRHVFRVAAIYGATAFVLLQLADLLVEALKLPGDFLTMITVLVLLGFPVAIILAWAFEVTPEGVRRTDAASADELAEIVAQPASQRWPAGLLALVGVGALVLGAWWVGRQTAPATAGPGATDGSETRLAYADPTADGRPSIAVLPFADMSREGDQGYFSDGMTEEILNTLAKIQELRVAARTSTFAYKGESRDLREVGNELGVEYIVEGSVRKDGDQLRITAQLIDASDGSHLWSESYDRTLESVFAIQTEIAEAIAEALRVPLGLDASELVQPTDDLEAYDLYLAGRAHMRQRQESLRDAVRLFEAAVTRDSSWAPAWAGLAEAKELIGWYPEAVDDLPEDPEAREAVLAGFWDESESATMRALELDPDNASALVALGSVQRNRRNWEASEAAYLRALASDPDSPEAHQQYAEMLTDVGRIAEGLRAAERATRLDRAAIRLVWHAYSLMTDDRLPEATQLLEEAVAEFPDFFFLEFFLGATYLRARRFDELVGLPPIENAVVGFHWDVPRGERDEIVRRLRQGDASMLPAMWREEPGVWMALGHPDSALAWARVRHDAYLVDNTSWVWDPLLDPIRDEPEMQAVMREMNLEGRTLQRTARDGANTP